MTSVTAQQIIALAKTQVGVQEGGRPGHYNNYQKFSNEVPGFKWSDGQPWCATFVNWVFWKAGAWDLIPKSGHSASCDIMGKSFKDAKRWGQTPTVGAIVFYGSSRDLSHVGIVIEVGKDYIVACEGNTNDEGSREGHEVAIRKRARNAYIVGYGYPAYAASAPASKPVVKKPTAASKRTAQFVFAHLSGEFSDTPEQRISDLEVIFSRQYDVITGTEVGRGNDLSKQALNRIAAKYGYKVSNPAKHDTWVAVKSALISGGWQTGSIPALPPSSKFSPTPPGKWGEKGVTWASWEMGPTFGKFAVASVHLLTKGGTGSDAAKTATDRKYLSKVRDWQAALPKVVEAFVGGDFNRGDRASDVFMGVAPFVTSADEVKEWKNTGHGPIDGIARETASTRVKAVSVKVLDDTVLPINSDHFVLETVYEVAAL